MAGFPSVAGYDACAFQTQCLSETLCYMKFAVGRAEPGITVDRGHVGLHHEKMASSS